MAQELQLVQHQSGFLFPATPESREFLQSNCKPGAVLVAEFTKVRNPAFQRKYFALLNFGFEYWEPGGAAISSNECRLVNGYAKYLMTFGGDETAFQQLYKASLDVLWRWILSHTFQTQAQAENAAAALPSSADSILITKHGPSAPGCRKARIRQRQVAAGKTGCGGEDG